nr:MAG TPA: hypothetical protein [Caudoviricetes sp.]
MIYKRYILPRKDSCQKHQKMMFYTGNHDNTGI